MSFIIQGINMPTDGTNITLTIKSDGTYESIYDTEICGDVIQIPKGHGRLIDGDEYLKAMKPRGISNEVWEESETYKSILNAPTILEAEE